MLGWVQVLAGSSLALAATLLRPFWDMQGTSARLPPFEHPTNHHSPVATTTDSYSLRNSDHDTSSAIFYTHLIDENQNKNRPSLPSLFPPSFPPFFSLRSDDRVEDRAHTAQSADLLAQPLPMTKHWASRFVR